jgi:hypothetical protein
MSAFTAKVFQAGKAPKRIALLGDKKRPESAQHVIEFPGGAIELTRTTDGDYWAHIIVNRGDVVDDADGRVSALGQVIDGRIGRGFPNGVGGIDGCEDIEQIAVLIRSTKAA